MLYNIFYPLHDYYPIFNVFRYITFRSVYALITAFFISLVLGPWVISYLKNLKLSQKFKGYEPECHKVKEGIPTMGGVLIILSTVFATLLWADLKNVYIWIIFLVFISTSILGFIDDYIKTVRGQPNGIKARVKFLYQSVIACIAVYFIIKVNSTGNATILLFPFFKNMVFDLGFYYYFFAIFVIVGTSNAVNLTDGLDGLAIMPSVIAFGTFVLFSYLTGHIAFSEYLNIEYIRGSGELAVFCSAMVGSGLGFLWFNAFPASVFMGDLGSLPIGSALGTIAVITKQEILLAIVGIVFVIETISVILQVGFFKATKGKKLFKMAPIHHHFELKNWSEPKIIVRFWIISFIFALLALSTLKLR